jgi:inactivated superfamily I helicase
MAMTFNYFVLNLKMAMMHTFTAKFIDEQDAIKTGQVVEETYDEFVLRHVYAFTAVRGASEQQVKSIEAAILEAKEEAKLHVTMFNAVTDAGTGRNIDQVQYITQFWEDNFVS